MAPGLRVRYMQASSRRRDSTLAAWAVVPFPTTSRQFEKPPSRRCLRAGMVEPKKGSARSVVLKRSGWPLCGFSSVLEWAAPRSGASYLATPFGHDVWASLFELGLDSYGHSFRQQGSRGFVPSLRVDGRGPRRPVAFSARSPLAMPLPYGVPKNPELLRFKPSHTLLFGVCSLPLTEHEAERSTLQGKEV